MWGRAFNARLLITPVFYCALVCCTAISSAVVCSAQNVKVIGYLPHYRMYAVGDIEFERLTHVNIAFANPNAEGNLSCNGVNITPAITAAHNAGCKVFVSLGGGALTPAWEDAWDSLAQPARRADFIVKIVKYVSDNRFDGVDMDLEWQYVKVWYSPFIIDLAAALKPLGLPLTAALPGQHRYAHISDSALAVFDWVNMMIYDRTGPWDPSNPGPHAPFAWTQQCINYWKSQNVPARKLVVGVPFYGYNFGGLPVVSVRYAQLVAQDTANAYRDNIDATFWNGIPTIKAKTALAMQQTAGVMIWELGQDAFGALAPLSLLRAIDEVVDDATTATEIVDDDKLVLYPNPIADVLRIGSAAATSEMATRIVVRDVLGRIVAELVIGGDVQSIPTSNWGAGTYYAHILTGRSVTTRVIVKQ